MGSGKIRSLVVRPIQSADIAADRAGVLAEFHPSVRLGATVKGASRAALLKDIANPSPSGQMRNAEAVHAVLWASALARIGNEEEGLELDALVLEHHNRLLSGMADPASLASTLADFHRDKQQLLDSQLKVHKEKADKLSSEYGTNDVVKKSTSTSSFVHNVGQYSSVYLHPMTMRTPKYDVGATYQPGDGKSTTNYPETLVMPTGYNAATQQFDVELSKTPVTLTFEEADKEHLNPTVSGFLNQVERTVVPPQSLVTDLIDLRHPRLEQRFADLRVEQQLGEAITESKLANAKVAKLAEILANEAAMQRGGVALAQVRLARTYLSSEIDGIVTAIYKDPGEFVQVGEPVLRVESDHALLLVGQVQHKGLIGVGSLVTIDLANLAESGDKVQLSGEVVVVRGHDADDDEWDITVLVKDHRQLKRKLPDGSIKACVLPLNLHVDHLDSTITFR